MNLVAAQVEWVPIVAMVGALASAIVTGVFALRGSRDNGLLTANADLRDDQAVALRDERDENKKIRDQRDLAEANLLKCRSENESLRRRLAKYEAVEDLS